MCIKDLNLIKTLWDLLGSRELKLKAELSISKEIISAIAQEVANSLKTHVAQLLETRASEKGLMGVDDLVKYLGVSKDWIYQRTANNEIPFVKLGHLVKFRKSDIELWLLKGAVPALVLLSAPLPRREARDCESGDMGKCA